MATMLDRSESRHDEFSAAILEGLHGHPKKLPPKCIYDEAGMRLLRDLSAAPSYYLDRCQKEILDFHLEKMLSLVPVPTSVVDLNPDPVATPRILERLLHSGKVVYFPVSPPETTVDAISSRVGAHGDRLRTVMVAKDLQDAIATLPGHGTPRLVLGLGDFSSRLSRTALLSTLKGLRQQMGGGDRLLMGIDSVKNPATLFAEYNDANGVAAKLNRHVLQRLNTDFGAEFEPLAFEHRAFWSAPCSRVEMHLVSRHEQVVALGSHAIHFRAGESIQTFSSYRYTVEEARALEVAASLACLWSASDAQGWVTFRLLATKSH